MTTEHTTDNNLGWAKKSVRAYVLGFILCLMLTLLSFGFVQFTPVSKELLYVLLTVFAVAQLLVQSVCFLGLNNNKDGQWNLLPFIFTGLIIFFLVGGSLWIMYNLNSLMIDSYLVR